MKVDVLKNNHYVGGKRLEKGEQEVDAELGEKLVNAGFAEKVETKKATTKK